VHPDKRTTLMDSGSAELYQGIPAYFSLQFKDVDNRKYNRLASHEGLGSLSLLLGTFPGVPMDMVDVLTLMISFGMLIAVIMSDKAKLQSVGGSFIPH